MSKRINIDSDEVWQSPGYPMSQAVAEPDGRRVHLSGQVAWDTSFKVLHVGDAASQTRAAFENIRKVLAVSGGTLDDIVTLATYYVREEDRDDITEVRRQILNKNFGPATIAIQAAKIWEDDILVELVATAVIPSNRFIETCE